MYSYDCRRTAGGPLKVTETAPVKFEYAHSSHGPVTVEWTGDSWIAVTKDHKIHRLDLGGLSPIVAGHPNGQRVLVEKVEKVLGPV
jgi:hypothetical protein